MKRTWLPVGLAILSSGCAFNPAAFNFGWFKPGASQQEFAQDRYQCMASSQMNVSQEAVNGSSTPYYGSVNGGSSSYTTTNSPLFSACMQARGYAWTNEAEVEKYQASQSNYQPPATAISAPPPQSASSKSGDAYYDCMKAHHWAESAEALCQNK